MGLDAVEIVLRAEELFVITIDDEEAGAVRTVGDFYKLICAKLDVVPRPSPITSEVLPAITQKRSSFYFSTNIRPCLHHRKFYRGHHKAHGTAW